MEIISKKYIPFTKKYIFLNTWFNLKKCAPDNNKILVVLLRPLSYKKLHNSIYIELYHFSWAGETFGIFIENGYEIAYIHKGDIELLENNDISKKIQKWYNKITNEGTIYNNWFSL